MSPTMLSRTSALLVVLVASQAAGQTEASQISFPRVREATLRALLGNFRAYENRAAVAGSSYVGSPRTGITRADSVTAVSVASAAVGADVDGALAGITVSPLLLFGVMTPHQLKATLATLEGGKLRVGLGYSHEGIWDPNTYQALGLAACRLTDADIARVEREMDALEEPFLRVCRALVEVLPEGPGPNNAYLQARAACAGESLGPGNEPALNQIFALRAKAALDRARADPSRRGDVAATEEELQEPLDKLGAFTTPTVDACHDDPGDPTSTVKIARAYVAAAFAHPQLRYGVGTTFEFDAFRWGFSPDDKPLPKGEVTRIEALPELSFKGGRLETYGSFGVGATRASGQESLHLLLSPKLGISWLACFLGRASASDAEKVIRETGELPPHLVLGFSASVDLAPDRPTTQPKLVEGAELTAYVDLRFSNDLAFRLGVPVKATLVKREATATVPERSDLQWSVPVSIVALIKQ